MYENVKFLKAGDKALVMEFGDSISKDINAKIALALEELKEIKADGIIDVLPTYRSILINYEPSKIRFNELLDLLKSIKLDGAKKGEGKVKLIEIPTLYGGEYGPDISFVAEHAKLSEEEVIKIHSGTDYLVYMMGFLPGFTYLGGLDERLVTPRLKSPRLKIEAGSVGIASNQTGMYPVESPGGWQLIGRTPLKLYDESKNPPVFIEAGNYIRYVPINEDDYKKIEEEVKEGKYQVVIKEVERGELNE